jgi:putative ABC transport system permease protein
MRSVEENLVLEIVSDVRYAVRRLSQKAGFTAAAVVVLALGIGANVTIFSALHAALVAGLPYPDADRLVLPAVSQPRVGEGPDARLESWSYPRYQLYREQPDLLVHPVAAYALGRPTLSGERHPIRLDAEIVSADYFGLLGVSALLGRTFTADEDDAATPPEVVLVSHALWQARFGGDESVLLRRLSLNGLDLRVVGVMPPGFKGLTGRGELWVPMAASGALFGQWRIENPDVHWLHVLGRIPADVRRDRAEAQMSLMADRISRAFIDPEATPGAHRGVLRPLRSAVVNTTARLSIQILAGAAALVLLIACANLAALLLTRAEAGRRETSVRLAIGAGRWRIIRQALVESTLLALLGATAGVGVAKLGIDGLVAMAPEALTRGSARLQYLDLGSLGLDANALLFALGLAGATTLLFGLAPAWRLSNPNLVDGLKNGGGCTRGAGGRPVLGRCLVGAQVALAMVLLVGAGLMTGSLIRLHQVDTGIDAAHGLLTLTYPTPGQGPASSPWPGLETVGPTEDPAAFHERFLDRIRSIPGVRDATVGWPPLGGIGAQTAVRQIGNGPAIPRQERTVVVVDVVEESFARTVGGRLLAGRGFTRADRVGAPPVVMLNESAARALFPSESPLGKRIGLPHGPAPDGETAEVVGVIRDVLYEGPDVGTWPAVYSSFRQVPLAEASVIVRADGDPMSLLPAIREALRQIDPTLPVYRVSTIGALAAQATATPRMIMSLLGLFAAAALALSAVGVYGSGAYAVSLRRREIGLRLALGARSRHVMAWILGQGLATAAVGALVGLATALAVVRVLTSLLYGVTPQDPATYAVAAGILLAVALLASYLPARTATRVDPMEVLRAD